MALTNSLKDELRLAEWLSIEEADPDFLNLKWSYHDMIGNTLGLITKEIELLYNELPYNGFIIEEIFSFLGEINKLEELIFQTRDYNEYTRKSFSMITKPNSLKKIEFTTPHLLPRRFLDGIEEIIDWGNEEWDPKNYNWLPSLLKTYKIGDEMVFKYPNEYCEAIILLDERGIRFRVANPYYINKSNPNNELNIYCT